MDISSSISPVAQTTYIPPLSATSATSSTDPTSTTSSATGTQLSTMGQLMSQLQNLESSDPAKAKTVLAKIGSDLKSKADSTGDTKLGALADKFTQASQTGSISGLDPPKGGGHGGHHHHHGGGGGGGQSPTTASSQVGAYQQSGSDPMSEIESAISSALGS
jgi:hypothetical protein